MDKQAIDFANNFVQDCFLSESLSQWKSDFISCNSSWFGLAKSANQVMQTIIMNGETFATDNPEFRRALTSSAFMIRAVSTFQACVLLLEHGLMIEAKTLLRSLLETTFYLCALREKGDGLVDQLESEHHHARRNLGNALLGCGLTFYPVSD